jgi:acetoin utilization protein AcuB
MLVLNWMSPQVITIKVEETLHHAEQLLKEHKINMLPVMHNRKVVGVLSKLDLKRAYATLMEQHELTHIIAKIRVKEIMTKDPITVPPDYTLEEAAELMMSKDIAGLPVVAAGGELVGVITRQDLLKALVSLTGLGRKGVQFAFWVADRPGAIKELTDSLRHFGGRIASILSTYEGALPGFRKVYLRAYNIDRDKLPQLFKELQAKATMIYFVDRRKNLREIYRKSSDNGIMTSGYQGVAKEMRQFLRMHMPLTMRYHIHISEPSERLWGGQGVMKNISDGGAYFTCEDDLQLDVGYSGIFTISIISSLPDFPVNSDIVFKGLVKRLEPPTAKSASFGVAVQFLPPMAIVPKDLNPPGSPANSQD